MFGRSIENSGSDIHYCHPLITSHLVVLLRHRRATDATGDYAGGRLLPYGYSIRTVVVGATLKKAIRDYAT